MWDRSSCKPQCAGEAHTAPTVATASHQAQQAAIVLNGGLVVVNSRKDAHAGTLPVIYLKEDFLEDQVLCHVPSRYRNHVFPRGES